jgi:hypothetical protein
MTDRKELIEIGVQAVLRAYKDGVGNDDGGDEQFVTYVVDAIEPVIRADEREKATPVFVSSAPVIKAMDDLKTRVEAEMQRQFWIIEVNREPIDRFAEQDCIIAGAEVYALQKVLDMIKKVVDD